MNRFTSALKLQKDFSNYTQVYNLTNKSAATKALKFFLASTRRFAPKDANMAQLEKLDLTTLVST